MLDASTLSLILSLAGFVLVAIVVVHHHNCSDQVRRRRIEVRHVTTELTAKANAYEQQITDLQRQIEEIDEQIRSLEEGVLL